MKILFPLDDNIKAQQEALRIARTEKAQLVALLVCDRNLYRFLCNDWLLGADPRTDLLYWAEDKEAESDDCVLEKFKELAGDFPVDFIKAKGDARKIILEEAKKDYDLLVLSRPFYSGLGCGKCLLPRLIRKVPCNILLVSR